MMPSWFVGAGLGKSLGSFCLARAEGFVVGSGRRRSFSGRPVLGRPVLGKPVLGRPVLGRPVLGRPVLGKPVLGKLLEAEGSAGLGKPPGNKPGLAVWLPRLGALAAKLFSGSLFGGAAFALAADRSKFPKPLVSPSGAAWAFIIDAAGFWLLEVILGLGLVGPGSLGSGPGSLGAPRAATDVAGCDPGRSPRGVVGAGLLDGLGVGELLAKMSAGGLGEF